MPDEVQFVCKSCRDDKNPEWLDSVRQEIQAGYVYVRSVTFFSCILTNLVQLNFQIDLIHNSQPW